mmetsp:Transcript_41129/g.65118  ORF Transcript_41129/g.65118 Transcript_41129/m.65118 type:complete len:282 (-) Transcript_41129:283-1128(-)
MANLIAIGIFHELRQLVVQYPQGRPHHVHRRPRPVAGDGLHREVEAVRVHLRAAEILSTQLSGLGGTPVAKDAVSMPRHLDRIFDVQFKDFSRTSLNEFDLFVQAETLRRRRIGHVLIHRDDGLVIHHAGGHGHKLRVVLGDPLLGFANHLEALILLHLGNDDAILPSVHAILQCGISEGTGPNSFKGGPIRSLELARLLGIVLKVEMRHRQDLVFLVGDIQRKQSGALRALALTAILRQRHAIIWRDITHPVRRQGDEAHPVRNELVKENCVIFLHLDKL